MDRKKLKTAAFDVVLRGYDKRQVDERLRTLGAELATAEDALQTAAERVAMLEDEVNRSRSGGDPQPESNFGARVEKILMLAEEEAREVRNQADAAAAALVEQARAEVAGQRQRAEQEAAAWQAGANRRATEQDSALQRRSAALENARQELQRESERVRAQAQEEAEQIRKAVAQEADELFKAAAQDAEAARAEAAQLVAQARAEANRLVTTATENAQQRERASAHELHQLSRLHDEINADLYRAKEVLDSLFGATRPITGTTPGATTGASPAPAKRPKDDAPDRHQARTV